MRLQVGLISPGSGWEGLLQQQGIPFVVQDAALAHLSPVWIIHQDSLISQDALESFCAAGGSVLIEAAAWRCIMEKPVYTRMCTWALPQQNGLFGDLPPLDIYDTIAVPKDKTLKTLDANLSLFEQLIGPGCMTIIPWNVETLLSRYDVRRKKVWFPRAELPSERLCAVSKGLLRIVVSRLLERLFHRQNLPFVHRWFFPRDARSVFCFRLDTDFCSAADAKAMLALLQKHHLRATWFIDVADEARVKNLYATMDDQEIGLHCHGHVVFDDVERNRQNIRRGLAAMNRAGIKPQGFAAPFGEWNPALDEVLREAGFRYSGEFAVGYDDLPFFPLSGGTPSDVLQLPIHPISLGRLRRSHFSTPEMVHYFTAVVAHNAALQLPQIFYHHPHHGHLEVFDALFNDISRRNLLHMTLSQWAQWWRQRLAAKLPVEYHKNILEFSTSHPDVWMHLTTPKGSITVPAGTYDITALSLASSQKNTRPKDLARTRKWHWRDALYDYESRKGKRYHEDLFS